MQHVPQGRALSGEATRGRFTARDLAFVATFAGLIAALSLLPAITPFGIPVPVTAQTMGIMLAGGILGALRGGAAVLLYVALGALGLPIFAGGTGGLGVFAGPTVGYLVAFPLGAYAVGLLTEWRGAPYRFGWGLAANLIGGVALIYLLGIPGTAWRADISLKAAAVGSAWFLVGDIAKAIIAAGVARGVHSAYPGLLPVRTAARQ